MADQETASVEIQTDGAPIDAWEFNYFLYLFIATYVAASQRVLESGLSVHSPEQEFYRVAETIKPELTGIDGLGMAQLARKDLPYNLTIVDIRRENPLEIVFGGIAVALALAVIISGGEFKGPGFKAKLPPLGAGIERLRSAFGRKALPKRRQ